MRPPDASQTDRSNVRLTSDQALIDALRVGNISAFTEVVRLYAVKLEGYVRRMIHDPDGAADVVQDVFTELWQRRTTVEIRTSLQGYLYGSARYHALHVIRRSQLEERHAAEFLASETIPGIATATPSPDAVLEGRELNVTLARVLNTLSPRVRQVALLRWRDRLSRAEIAAVLGVSVPTIRNQLNSAANAFRKLLSE